MTCAFTVSVVTQDDVFSQLADRWDRLVDGCESATPFQTHAWLNSWWRAYGIPGRLRVVVVDAGPELVAAVALFVSRRRLVRVLSPVGVDLSDFCEVLVADSVREDRDLVGILCSAIGDVAGWDVVDLPEVRPGAVALELAAVWPGGSSTTPASTCLELPVQDLNDLVSALPRSTAKHIRRKLRKLDEVRVTSQEVAASDVPAAISAFHRLHLAQWQGRGVTAEHSRPRFRNFLTEALPLMVHRGQAVVAEYHLAGDLMGVRINVVGPSLMGGYLSGVSPLLRDHVDVTTLMLRHNMEQSLQRKTPVLSFLRGQEDYKLRWRPKPVLNRRVVLARPGSFRALIYLTATKAQAKVLPWLRTHVPWLKNLRTQARRLLGT